MLAGRNVVALVKQFNTRMAEFSDDGETFNGAYGYRWLSTFDYDQLKIVVDELKKDPDSRRCVVSMWDPRNDLQNAVGYHGEKSNRLQITGPAHSRSERGEKPSPITCRTGCTLKPKRVHSGSNYLKAFESVEEEYQPFNSKC